MTGDKRVINTTQEGGYPLNAKEVAVPGIDYAYRVQLEYEVMKRTAELNRQNELLEGITSMVPDIITVVELPSRNIVYSNNMNLALHGFSQEDMLKMSMDERRRIIHPDDLQIVKDYFDSFSSSIADDEIHIAEYRAKSKAGLLQTFFVRGRVFERQADGSVHTILNVIQNITHRKSAERQLIDEHRRFKEAQAIGHVGSFEWEADTDKVIWSDEMYRIHGVERHEQINLQRVFDLIHPEDIEEATKKMNRCRMEPGIISLTYRLLRQDGATRVVTRQLQSFADEDGKVSHITGTVQDITEQKMAEQALKESRDLLQHITEFIPDIITVQEYPSGRIIYYNRRPFKHSAQEPDTILSMPVDDREMTVYPEYLVGLQQYMASFATLGDNKVNTYEYKVRTEILDPVWIRSRGKVFERDANGNVKRILNILQNITEQRESEKDRVDRLISLRQKDVLLQQRDEFIGIASHELKTPITSIKAYADILQEMLEEEGDSVHSSLMQKLNDQVDRLASLIGDLLDTTRISSGQLILRLENFSLNDLVTGRVEELRRLSGQRHILLSAEESLSVYADKERIGQVVTNLISNAIKYSWDDSKITVTIARTANGTKVSVRDEGVGISKENLKRIFNRFFRANTGEMKNFQGMGLGLYISAEIIQRHGGIISAASEEGRGSEFWFVLPV